MLYNVTKQTLGEKAFLRQLGHFYVKTGTNQAYVLSKQYSFRPVKVG
jgi:hypothetical protein